MSKFYGQIGYAVTEEEPDNPGVWIDTIVEKNAFGDLIKNNIRTENSNNLNDNIKISNQVSIIAEPYALQNFHLIRYVKFMGIRWKVTDVDINQYPRLIMTLGGEYNG